MNILDKALPICLKLIKNIDSSYSSSILIKYFKTVNKSCDYSEFLDFVKFVAVSNDLINNSENFTKELFEKIVPQKINCREINKHFGVVQNLCKSCGICSSYYANKYSLEEENILSSFLVDPAKYHKCFVLNGGNHEIFRSVKSIIDDNGKARSFTVVKDIYQCIFNANTAIDDNLCSSIKDIPDFSSLKEYNSDISKNIFIGLFTNLKEMKVSEVDFIRSMKALMGVDVNFNVDSNITAVDNSISKVVRNKSSKGIESEQLNFSIPETPCDFSTNPLTSVFDVLSPKINSKDESKQTTVKEAVLPFQLPIEVSPIDNSTFVCDDSDSSESLNSENSNNINSSESTILINAVFVRDHECNISNSEINKTSGHGTLTSIPAIKNADFKNNHITINNINEFNNIRTDILSCRTLVFDAINNQYVVLYLQTNDKEHQGVLYLCNMLNVELKYELIRILQHSGICKIIPDIIELYNLLQEITYVKDCLDLFSLTNLNDKNVSFIKCLSSRMEKVMHKSRDINEISFEEYKSLFDNGKSLLESFKRKNYYSDLYNKNNSKKYVPLQEQFSLYNDYLNLSIHIGRCHDKLFKHDFSKKASISICNRNVNFSDEFLQLPLAKYLVSDDTITWVIESTLLNIFRSKLCVNRCFSVNDVTHNSISLTTTNSYYPYVIDMLNQYTITTFRNICCNVTKPIINLSL